MLLVAIDTSGRNGSVALCRGLNDRFETLQLIQLEGGTYSARLMPSVADALSHNGLNKTDIDALVVVSGPGSFTGLRVALATVKGLCEALHKPMATVSMLEAVVLQAGKIGAVTAVLDAGRGEVYLGEYEVSGEIATPVREYMAKFEDLISHSAGGNDLVTADPRLAELLRTSKTAVELVAPIQADQIGYIGLRKLLAGETADASTVDVNYIRRSDAEIFTAAQH